MFQSYKKYGKNQALQTLARETPPLARITSNRSWSLYQISSMFYHQHQQVNIGTYTKLVAHKVSKLVILQTLGFHLLQHHNHQDLQLYFHVHQCNH